MTPLALAAPDAAFAEPSLRRVGIASGLVIGLGVFGLLGWASVSEMESAVPAGGTIVSAGKRKSISLLEPGLLRELAVREGDRVAAGDVLLRLDDVQARSGADQARQQYWAAVAKASRLTAEALDKRIWETPGDLADAARDAAIAAQLDAERHLFLARWDAFDGQVRIAGRRIAEQQAEIAALAVQLVALRTRLSLLREELAGVESLLARGFAPRNRALELRRGVAELEGAMADAVGRQAQRRQGIAQTEAEIAGAAQTRRQDISRDRTDVQGAIGDAAQRLRAAEDVLERRLVRAPENGTVTDIRAFTPGSSIAPGQPVMDLVPADGRLLVEASVTPTDIERVHVGQKIRVRLTAYKSHRVPALSGRLVYVGADRQVDPRGEPFFLARAELDPDALKPYPGVALYAGMPAEVLVIGGRRTALDFLISPIRDGMRRGMTEE